MIQQFLKCYQVQVNNLIKAKDLNRHLSKKRKKIDKSDDSLEKLLMLGKIEGGRRRE